MRSSVGRSTELSTATWDSSEYNVDDQSLVLDWREVKTGNETKMYYGPDSEGWLLDTIHSLSCYIISNTQGTASSGKNNNEEEPDWIFPTLACLAKGGAAAHCTKLIQSCVGKVEGILKEHTSHTIRHGCTDDMAENSNLDIIAMIARGGWSFEAECCFFIYLNKNCHIKRAGQALAGFDDVKKKVYIPTLDMITSATKDEKEKLNLFMDHMFVHVNSKNFRQGGQMFEFRQVMIPSLLEHLDQMIKDIGEKTIVHKMIRYSATCADLPLERIQDFGREVRNNTSF